MKNSLFLAFLAVFPFILSCENKGEKKDNGLEEVRLNEKTRNADIVRMPISSDKPLDTVNVPKINFDSKEFDFGKVKEGTTVKHAFRFTNTGQTPLLITDVRTTCGCTIPTWNKNPIAPGSSDVLNVAFDTKQKLNEQVKKITLLANTYPSETVLILRGVVEQSLD
ncbi:MAG: DUF1573 domain-containing protein [Saprospiraceae bacterium]|nr:DUF1573 domain-containing protein [Saprospiraceae bacterium]